LTKSYRLSYKFSELMMLLCAIAAFRICHW